MGSYTLIKNTPLFVDLNSDFVDQGWSVSGNIAYHSGCNAGYIDRYMDLSSANQWKFEYEILSRDSGIIKIVVDGQSGAENSAVGEHDDTFNVTGSSVLVRFYSNGVNSLSLLKAFSPQKYVTGTTLAFNEKANRFISEYSYHPDFMLKFIDKFFTFKNGALWQHNVSDVMNNFYGEQYTSKITFYVNGNDPEEIKNFWGVIVNSNSVWSVPVINIFPTHRKPNGMKSRIKSGNFNNILGKWYADFLKNMIDPRFNTEIEALMKGADLQGQVMEITIENNSTVEARLVSVDVLYSKQNYSG